MTNQIQVTPYQQDTHCIYICNQTGEAYINLAQLEKLFPHTSKMTLSRRLKGVTQLDVKTAEIQTIGGLQRGTMYPSALVFKLAIEFDPELAFQMGQAGAKLYLYGLAGYQVSLTPENLSRQPLTSSTTQLLTQTFNEVLARNEEAYQVELGKLREEVRQLNQRPNLDQVQQLLAVATSELAKLSQAESEQPTAAPPTGRTWPLPKVIGLSGLTKAGFLRIWRKDGFIAAKSEFPTYEEMLAGRMMVVDGVTHITESGQQHYSQHMKTLDKLLIN